MIVNFGNGDWKFYVYSLLTTLISCNVKRRVTILINILGKRSKKKHIFNFEDSSRRYIR